MPSLMPAVEYDAPAARPAGLGLYEAATVTNTARPSRILAGVNVRPFNCAESFGTWPTDPCAAPPTGRRKAGDRVSPRDTFKPMQLWAYDECDPVETEEQSAARAQQTLRLQEPILVESAFGARLLADAAAGGAIPTVKSLAEGIGVLEEALGEAGYGGYIHASRRFAAPASLYRWDNQTGAVLKTPLRHSWVFGGGYGSVLGNTLIATGPVFVWRDELTSKTVLDPRINRRATVAERTVVAGYECLVAAVTITSTL